MLTNYTESPETSPSTIDEFLHQALCLLSIAPLTPPNTTTTKKSPEKTFTLNSRAAAAFYKENYTILKDLQKTLLGLNNLYGENDTRKSALKNENTINNKKKKVRFHSTRMNQICLFQNSAMPNEIQDLDVFYEPDTFETETKKSKPISTENSIHYLSITLINFPIFQSFDKLGQQMRMTSLSLDATRREKLTGIIHIRNLSFEKKVFVRYSFNQWKDFNEVEAKYVNSVADYRDTTGIGVDRFGFEVLVRKFVQDQLSGQNEVRGEFAVRYEVGDNIYWDNNQGANYKIILKNVLDIEVNKPILMFKRSSPVKMIQPKTIQTVSNNPKRVVLKKTSSFTNPIVNDSVYSSPTTKPAPLSTMKISASPPKLSRSNSLTKNPTAKTNPSQPTNSPYQKLDFSNQMQQKIALWYSATIREKQVQQKEECPSDRYIINSNNSDDWKVGYVATTRA